MTSRMTRLHPPGNSQTCRSRVSHPRPKRAKNFSPRACGRRSKWKPKVTQALCPKDRHSHPSSRALCLGTGRPTTPSVSVPISMHMNCTCTASPSEMMTVLEYWFISELCSRAEGYESMSSKSEARLSLCILNIYTLIRYRHVNNLHLIHTRKCTAVQCTVEPS